MTSVVRMIETQTRAETDKTKPFRSSRLVGYQIRKEEMRMGMSGPPVMPGGPRAVAIGCASTTSEGTDTVGTVTITAEGRSMLPLVLTAVVVGVVITLLLTSSMQEGQAGISSPQQELCSLSTATVEYRAVPWQ